MKITISSRFFPFSHRAGTHVLIPKTEIVVEVYPSRVNFFSCGSIDGYKMDIQTEGYVNGFTVVQDLERQVVRVFGVSTNGYISYELKFFEGYIVMDLLRSRIPLNIIFQAKKHTVLPKRHLQLFPVKEYITCPLPRLAFGIHKSQNIDHMAIRKDLREILPFLYRIGKSYPKHSVPIQPGTTKELVQKIRESIHARDKIGTTEAFHEFFAIAIRDLFVPQLFDYRLQGLFTPPETSKLYYDTSLLSIVSELIENLFLQEQGNSISLLPLLLPILHAGRLLTFNSPDNSYTLDMEWRSHKLRKVIFCSHDTRMYHFLLPKPFCNFRLRSSKEDPGIICYSGDLISVRKNSTYFFDRFQI